MKRVAVKIGKIILYAIGGILLLLVTAVLLLRLPSVQQYVTDKATAFISGKTHSVVRIGKLYVGFPKDIVIRELYAEDQSRDTLIYLKELNVNVALLQLLKSRLSVNALEIDGLTANIHRTLPDSSFNFDFIIRAFAGDGTKPRKEAAKDTAASTFSIAVDQVRLTDLRLLYDDAVSGIYTKGAIGTLSLDIDEIDLQQLRFKVDELVLSHTDAVFEIRKPSVPGVDTTTGGPLPYFAVNRLRIGQVNFGFHHIPDASFFDMKIGELMLQPKEIDLNKQWIDIDKLTLSKSDIRITMRKTTGKSKPAETTPSTPNNWRVAAAAINLSGNRFSYDVTNTPVARAGMDYNHLMADHIELDAKDLYYSPSVIRGKIMQLGLTERSGLDLKKLRTSFTYDDTHAELANLFIQTANSSISNYVSASYPSIASLGKNIGELKVKLSFVSTRVSVRDMLLFAPDLVKQPIIARNKHAVIAVSGKIDGKVNDIVAHNLVIRMATQTSVSLDARMKGLPDADKLWFDVNLKALTTGRSDLEQLLPDSIVPASVRVPDQLMLQGKARGTLKDLTADLLLKSSDGSAKVTGTFAEQSGIPKYMVDLETDELNAGRVLRQDPLLGKVTLHLKASGQSFDPKKIIAAVEADISKLELKGYPYHAISLNAQANKGLYKADVQIADKSLNLQLNSEVSLLEDSSFINLLLDIKGADLQNLRLADKDLRASGVLAANVRNFNSENMQGNLSVANVILIKDTRRYKMDSLIAVTLNERRKTSFSIANSIIEVDYKGSTGLHEIAAVMQNHIARYLGHTEYIADTVQQDFTCTININPDPVLSNILVPELTKFSGIVITSAFNSSKQELVLTANSSFIQYGSSSLKELNAKIISDEDRMTYDVSLAGISSGSYSLPKTSLTGSAHDNIIGFSLAVIHPDSGNKLLIAGNIDQQKINETRISITNGNIVFNNDRWEVSEKNEITIGEKGINIRDLNITHGGEFIKVNSVSSAPDDPIDISFGRFELGTLSRIIEQDTAIVRGLLDGDIHIKSISPFAFTSDLSIKNIAFNEVPVGDLQITGNNLSSNRYVVKVELSGNDNHATIGGVYENDQVDFSVNVQQLNLVSAETFSGKMIRQSKGYITADIKIKGKPAAPAINGSVSFKDASFNLALINNQLLLKDETIRIDDKGIYFKKFTVLDSIGQPLIVNGSVTDFSKFNFDLDISTKNFRVLNTTARDNKVYYGRMIVNSKIRITGNKNLPVVTADVSLANESSFTFVVQEGDLNTSRGEGVVFFIDTTSGNNIMSLKKDTVRMTSEFKGIDINANIEVNKNTLFRVIVDPKSGDNLEVTGDANLAFGIDQSGKISLSGTYTLNNGHYKASFQKVIKREFTIRQGSSITWSGDPMDGQMDLTAVYTTKAAATDLLAAELAGVSDSERNAYRKLLSYYVNLMLKGPILKPEISFSLDMAPKDQNAFGGLVYSKINLINTDPNELNKQVFSLLVLNKFLPTGNSNGTASSAVSTAARNSVNQVLSDQLNALSGKYIKGAELNFNLQTTEDYVGTTAQQNTALQVGVKKELFNQRVSVQVGSNIDLNSSQQTSTGAQNITGDVVVEYKITEDGRYRFKAFRENQFEGIIDGMLYKTGVGILFTRDYNSLKELFASPAKEKKEEPTETEK